ncbi:MAG: hypothetical protein IT444_03845 [Phycisphaeraceae bacterium]|nr:hypothetical protein [Phycisphaeraceae bacterium]
MSTTPIITLQPYRQLLSRTAITGHHKLKTVFLPATLFVLLLQMLVGCASQSAGPADSKGRRLDLEFKTQMTDHRYTYFEIKRGTLKYGGGRDGAQMEAAPVLQLSTEQLDAIWAIIDRYDLMNAKGSFLGKGETATYDLTLNDGRMLSHAIHATDDKVPGLKELHQLLFDYQATVRYRIPELETHNKS